MPDALTTTTAIGPASDLRPASDRRTAAGILTACRAMMVAGDFRPTVPAVAKAAGCSMRSVFQHFHSVEGLHRAALDVETSEAVAALIVPLPSLIAAPMVREFMVHAAVFGRPLNADAPAAAAAE